MTTPTPGASPMPTPRTKPVARCLACKTLGGSAHRGRPTRRNGLCANCYSRSRYAPVPVPPCIDCKTPGGGKRAGRPHRVKGRCLACWADACKAAKRAARLARIKAAPVEPLPPTPAPPELALFVPSSVPAPEPKRAPSPRYVGPLAWLLEAFDLRDFKTIYRDEHEEDAA